MRIDGDAVYCRLQVAEFNVYERRPMQLSRTFRRTWADLNLIPALKSGLLSE